MDLYIKTVEFIDWQHFRNAVAVVGGLYLLKVFLRELWTLGGGFCAFFLAPWGISRTNLKKYGEWAVVTGASEGIGKGYALELARQGLNVVVMSFDKEGLDKVADEIREKYRRQVKVVVVDFYDGQDVYPRIAEELKDLEIGVLVNNVGTWHYPDCFADVPKLRLRKVIELNCQTLVQMTHLLLPKMVERKRGVVVNLSSATSISPLQYLAVYSASKIFVKYFSDALRKEYASKGIEVQTVTPCTVVTAATSGFQKVSFMVPDGNQYARSAVATIGVQKTTFGSLSHAIQGYFLSMIPLLITTPLINRNLLAIKRALTKSKQQ